MKKMMMMVSMVGILILASACSEETVKKSEKEKTKVETVVVEDDNGEQVEGEVEYIEAELSDNEAYNQIYSIFLDKKMEESFKKLVGDDLDIFRVTFQQISPVPTEDENLFAFHGTMPGLEGVAEGLVIFDHTGNMWASVSEGENVNFYNNTKDVKKHHPIIEDWRQSFFAGSTVVYKNE